MDLRFFRVLVLFLVRFYFGVSVCDRRFLFLFVVDEVVLANLSKGAYEIF